MRYLHLKLVVLMFAFLTGLPTASAKKLKLSKSKHIKDLSEGLKVIKQGRFSDLKGVKVRLEDGDSLTIPALAKKMFAIELRNDKRLKAAFDKKILFKGPVVEEHAIETKKIVTLTRSTTYVIKDQKRFAKEFPDQHQFEPAGPTVKTSDVQMNKLSSDAVHKAWFKDLKDDVLSKPKSHPLRMALKKDGDAGLVAAVMNGLGDITVIDTLVFPKKAKLDSGELQEIELTPKGIKLKTRKGPKKAKIGPKKVLAPRVKKVPTTPLDQTSTKELTGAVNKGGFLTGFTRTKGWKKSKSIGGGFMKASFTVRYGYAFGLRVPIRVTWKVDPALALTESNIRRGKDKQTNATVTLTAKPAEQGKSFYEDTGLSAKKVYNGKEIFVGAWANATAKLYIAGKKVFSKTKGLKRKDAEKCIKTGKGPCFSREMQPPWGGKQPLKLGKTRDRLKTPKVWLPASLTKSKISKKIPYVASGYAQAQVGLKFGGVNSKVTMDYRAIIDGKKKKKQRLTFRPKAEKITKKIRVSRIPSVKKGKKSAHKFFGFELSKPRYKTTITATPGIKLSAGGKLAWQKKNTKLKPIEWFFSSAKIKLFSAALGPHAGTNTKIDCSQCGVKQYRVK